MVSAVGKGERKMAKISQVLTKFAGVGFVVIVLGGSAFGNFDCILGRLDIVGSAITTKVLRVNVIYKS